VEATGVSGGYRRAVRDREVGQQAPLLSRRLRRRDLVLLDGLAAAGYALTLLGAVHGQAPGAPGWAARLAVAGTALPLPLRRRWPVPVCLVVIGAAAAALAGGVVRDAPLLPLLAVAFALYPVAVTLPRPRREPTTLIGVLTVVGLISGPMAGTPQRDGRSAGLVLTGLAVIGGGWTVGRAVRERRQSAAQAAERRTEQAVAEERLRLARELHDVVSHTLSLIGVKAAIANHVADTRPDEVRDALRVIETTSRDALTEMRQMLGVLRADPPVAELRPAPGLAELAELADRATQAGVRVDLQVRGVDRLPRGVELSVYRIVQEAVTNVVKHAAPARCRVAVTGTAEGVRVEISDDGPGPRSPGRAGHGLIGMRERVAMHGGEFAAGPGRHGGFTVSAVLSCRPDEPAAVPGPAAEPARARNPPPTRPVPPGVGSAATPAAGRSAGSRA
jgi:signal transduction histidine kinase